MEQLTALMNIFPPGEVWASSISDCNLNPTVGPGLSWELEVDFFPPLCFPLFLCIRPGNTGRLFCLHSPYLEPNFSAFSLHGVYVPLFFSLYLKGDVILLFLHRNFLLGDSCYVFLFGAYLRTCQAESDYCFCCARMKSSGSGNFFSNF